MEPSALQRLHTSYPLPRFAALPTPPPPLAPAVAVAVAGRRVTGEADAAGAVCIPGTDGALGAAGDAGAAGVPRLAPFAALPKAFSSTRSTTSMFAGRIETVRCASPSIVTLHLPRAFNVEVICPVCPFMAALDRPSNTTQQPTAAATAPLASVGAAAAAAAPRASAGAAVDVGEGDGIDGECDRWSIDTLSTVIGAGTAWWVGEGVGTRSVCESWVWAGVGAGGGCRGLTGRGCSGRRVGMQL